MSETDLMRRIQIACCRDPAVRLWRNNNGVGWVGDIRDNYAGIHGRTVVLVHARAIRFGLGEGTADLIGGRSTLITPEMVGQRVFVFAGVEVKTRRSRSTPEQRAYIQVVKSLGGLADIARDENEAYKVLTALDR